MDGNEFLRCSVDWGAGISKECSLKWEIKVHSLINQSRFVKWNYWNVTERTFEAEIFTERTHEAENFTERTIKAQYYLWHNSTSDKATPKPTFPQKPAKQSTKEIN